MGTHSLAKVDIGEDHLRLQATAIGSEVMVDESLRRARLTNQSTGVEKRKGGLLVGETGGQRGRHGGGIAGEGLKVEELRSRALNGAMTRIRCRVPHRR